MGLNTGMCVDKSAVKCETGRRGRSSSILSRAEFRKDEKWTRR